MDELRRRVRRGADRLGGNNETISPSLLTIFVQQRRREVNQIMVRLVAALAVVAACAAPAWAFAPQSGTSRARTVLSAEQQDGGKQFAAGVVASAYLLGGLAFGADAALAESYSTAPTFGGGSTVLLAAKSGGRAGGRVASGGPGNAKTAGTAASSSTTNTRTIVKKETTIIQQPQVVQAAPQTVIMAPAAPVYDPGPGLGLAMGINAIGAIGEGMREARQEREIATAKAEVQVMKQREQDMEARLRMMEQNQMMGQQQMMNQQMLSNQLQMQAAAARAQ